MKNLISKLVKKLLRKPRITILGLGILIILSFFSWRRFNKTNQQPQFQTSQVERGTIVSSVSASGQVLSVNIISATTKASGIVKEVYVKDGDVVREGDKILEIALDRQGQQKSVQAYSSYLSARNSLESAKATQYTLQADMFGKWDIFKELAESDEYDEDHVESRNLPEYHIPEKEWLATEAKYKNQAAVVVQAQTAVNSGWLAYQLVSPTITAPANGTVTSLMFTKGMNIGSLDMGTSESNQKVAMIKTEGTPIISINLSEIDVFQVELGQKADIVLDSIADETFTGKVVGVDRIGANASGVTQYPAIIQLDSSAPQILPNMAVTASIIIDVRNSVLLVPSTAVIEQGGQTLVRVLKNKDQQMVPVEVGLISEIQSEIISGLEEGETVIVGMGFDDKAAMSDDNSPFSSTRGGMGGMIRGAPH